MKRSVEEGYFEDEWSQMLSLLFQTLLVWKGNVGSVLGSTPTLKKTLQKSEDESCNPILWVFGFLVLCLVGFSQCYGEPPVPPGPFGQPFCRPTKFAACRPAIFGTHENGDRPGESLKRWETWFLFGPGYCT